MQNLLFSMLALAGETNCEEEHVRRICVMTLGRLEMLITAMYMRIKYLESCKEVDKLCGDLKEV